MPDERTPSCRGRAAARLVATLLPALLLLPGSASPANAEWLEVRTDHFTVITDGSERRARHIAWQFEQVRAAIRTTWPWAHKPLDRPVEIVAARDENTMRMLVPGMFSASGSDSIIVACLASRPDRHAIIMRGDFEQQDRAGTINPYFASYSIFSTLALDNAFKGRMGHWFVRGFVELLSNTLISDDYVDFGRAHPSTLATLRNESRLRLRDLLTATRDSPYLDDGVNRARFDAQSFGVIHYLLFGLADTRPGAIDEIARRLFDGETSVEAVAAVFGSVEALEEAYSTYHRRPITQFLRVKTDNRIPRTFPVRSLSQAEALTMRASVHSVYRRTPDVERLLLEARKAEPAAAETFVVEGLHRDQNKQPVEAAAAYARAMELGSDNFYAWYRSASDLARSPEPANHARALLHAERAAALNPEHGPSQSLLGTILAAGPNPTRGVEPARRGLELDPSSPRARLALATVLQRLGRNAEALGLALAARASARTEDERAEAQQVVNALAPPSLPAQ
jgi:tetratricopeptide (TPR) repeat protein